MKMKTMTRKSATMDCDDFMHARMHAKHYLNRILKTLDRKRRAEAMTMRMALEDFKNGLGSGIQGDSGSSSVV